MTDVGAIVGHVVLLITTIAGFLFQWKREARNHQWQCERLRELKADIKTHGMKDT